MRHARSAIAFFGTWAFTAGASGLVMQESAPPPAPLEQGEQDPPREEQDATEQSAEEGGGDPSTLDELLGLEEDDQSRGARDAAEQDAQEALDRALSQEEVSDAFKEAMRKMALTAGLLMDELDPGLGTQRLQQDILAKLDELIESARNQSSSSSSSSSASSQSSQQQQQRPRQQQQNQQSQGDPSQQSDAANPADDSAPRPPGEEQGDLSAMLEETGVEWGALPERVRDQLLQASKDQPSSLYRRLTQEYYKRLAEESNQ